MKHIDTWLRQLRESFGAPRRTIDTTEIERLYREGEMTKAIGVAKRLMIPVPMKLRASYVNSGGPAGSLAWIRVPPHFPSLLSREFGETVFTMFIRRDFIACARFETWLCAVSHELAHIIVESVYHTERDNERFVDLTAMFFGFSEIFRAGKVLSIVTTTRDPETMWERLKGWTYSCQGKQMRVVKETTTTIGYLTPDEIEYAHRKLVDMRYAS